MIDLTFCRERLQHNGVQVFAEMEKIIQAVKASEAEYREKFKHCERIKPYIKAGQLDRVDPDHTTLTA